MRVIAHRGNLFGPDRDSENTNAVVHSALEQGFDVEVDVWYEQGGFWLGHDAPRERADLALLLCQQIWWHAKHMQALQELLRGGQHCFVHDYELGVMTSRGWWWCLAGRPIDEPYAVCVLPENFGSPIPPRCGAVCTDYAMQVRACS